MIYPIVVFGAPVLREKCRDKALVDKISATIILQGYMESQS